MTRSSAQRSPVSSSTSRTAASSSVSPEFIFPLGSVQSSYFGRWTSAISRTPPLPVRHTRPPAARTSTFTATTVPASAPGVAMRGSRPPSRSSDVLPRGSPHRQREEPLVNADRLASSLRPAAIGSKLPRQRVVLEVRPKDLLDASSEQPEESAEGQAGQRRGCRGNSDDEEKRCAKNHRDEGRAHAHQSLVQHDLAITTNGLDHDERR